MKRPTRRLCSRSLAAALVIGAAALSLFTAGCAPDPMPFQDAETHTFAGGIEGRETPRDRVLSDAELGEVWRAAGRLGWPSGDFVRFLLLTLQREQRLRACGAASWPRI